MAKVIEVKNPVLPDKEDTFLTSKYTSGTALTVKSNEGWADNDIAVVGNPGEEITEYGSVSGTTGNEQIDLDSALKFDHVRDTPIFRSSYDNISLERKPSGGSFAEIAEGKAAIEWDEKDGHTKIDVAAGVDSDTYRWRFYNSQSGTYSAYSGELPGTGLTQFQAGYLMGVVRDFGKIPASLGVTDRFLLQSFNRCQREIDTLHDRWYFTLVEDSDSTRVTSVTSTYKYDLPSTFRGMDVLKVLDENSQKYNLAYVPLVQFDALKVDDADTDNDSNSTRMWTLLPPDSDNTVGYFGVHPTPEDTSIYFYRRYWRYLPELTSFASTTLIPLPEALINWAMFEIYKMREDRDNSMFYYQQYLENVTMLKRLQRRQVGQSQLFHWRGQRAMSRYFGSIGATSLDTIRENYW